MSDSGDLSRFENWIYPELALFPDRNARAEARQLMRISVVRAVLAGVFLSIVGATVMYVVVAPLTRRIGIPHAAVQFFTSQAAVTVGFLVVAMRYRSRNRRRLRERLVELGMPVCLHCGYDLRGQTEARCPECGRAFDAKLLADKQADGRVPLAAGGGCAGGESGEDRS